MAESKKLNQQQKEESEKLLATHKDQIKEMENAMEDYQNQCKEELSYFITDNKKLKSELKVCGKSTVSEKAREESRLKNLSNELNTLKRYICSKIEKLTDIADLDTSITSVSSGSFLSAGSTEDDAFSESVVSQVSTPSPQQPKTRISYDSLTVEQKQHVQQQLQQQLQQEQEQQQQLSLIHI